jgi:hypothetical protein
MILSLLGKANGNGFWLLPPLGNKAARGLTGHIQDYEISFE